MRNLVLGVLALGLLGGCATTPATQGEELVLRDGKWVPPAAAEEGSAEGERELVRLHITRGENRSAIRATKKFFKRYPDSPVGEEVLLLAIRAELARGRYMQAYEWCEKLLEQFPTGDHYESVVDQEFEIAEEFLAGRKRIVLGFIYLPAQDEGLSILTRVAEHVPGSDRAEDAMLRIGDYYFERGDYAEAADAYDDYLALFAKSQRAPFAMHRAALAIYRTYRGAPYEDGPLIEADLRFAEFEADFPSVAGRVGVGKLRDEIAAARARKDYLTGRFYERTGYPNGAAFYYREVLDRYRQPEWSAKAEEALTALAQRGKLSPEPSR
jgi:outer membrane protein assembly factor BamD (BamD/ComL family)